MRIPGNDQSANILPSILAKRTSQDVLPSSGAHSFRFAGGAVEEPIDVLNSSSIHWISNMASPLTGMLPTHDEFAPHMSMYIPLGGSGTGTCRVVVFVWISSTKRRSALASSPVYGYASRSIASSPACSHLPSPLGWASSREDRWMQAGLSNAHSCLDPE